MLEHVLILYRAKCSSDEPHVRWLFGSRNPVDGNRNGDLRRLDLLGMLDDGLEEPTRRGVSVPEITALRSLDIAVALTGGLRRTAPRTAPTVLPRHVRHT